MPSMYSHCNNVSRFFFLTCPSARPSPPALSVLSISYKLEIFFFLHEPHLHFSHVSSPPLPSLHLSLSTLKLLDYYCLTWAGKLSPWILGCHSHGIPLDKMDLLKFCVPVSTGIDILKGYSVRGDVGISLLVINNWEKEEYVQIKKKNP